MKKRRKKKEKKTNDVGTMLERCWERCWNDVGTMLERCSTSRLAKIGQLSGGKPCKEIGTPSLKAVGEKNHFHHFFLKKKLIFFILPPWPSLRKKSARRKV